MEPQTRDMLTGHLEKLEKRVVHLLSTTEIREQTGDDPIPTLGDAEMSLVNRGIWTYSIEMSYRDARERIWSGLTVACRQMKEETKSHVEQFHEKVKMAIESWEIDGTWFGTMMDLLREIFASLVPIRQKKKDEREGDGSALWMTGDDSTRGHSGNGTEAGGSVLPGSWEAEVFVSLIHLHSGEALFVQGPPYGGIMEGSAAFQYGVDYMNSTWGDEGTDEDKMDTPEEIEQHAWGEVGARR